MFNKLCVAHNIVTGVLNKMSKNNYNDNQGDKPKDGADHEHCPNCATPKGKNSTENNFFGTPGHVGEQKYFPSLENKYEDSTTDEATDELEELPEEYL